MIHSSYSSMNTLKIAFYKRITRASYWIARVMKSCDQSYQKRKSGERAFHGTQFQKTKKKHPVAKVTTVSNNRTRSNFNISSHWWTIDRKDDRWSSDRSQLTSAPRFPVYDASPWQRDRWKAARLPRATVSFGDAIFSSRSIIHHTATLLLFHHFAFHFHR